MNCLIFSYTHCFEMGSNEGKCFINVLYYLTSNVFQPIQNWNSGERQRNMCMSLKKKRWNG